MAYLNVRERRLETKIAYVGPAFSGKATNLDRLRTDVVRGRASDLRTLEEGEAGELVALDWMPLQMPRFNDCDVAVKVVAAKGSLSTERLDDLFEDCDGVVVVVDAAPSAQDENRRAVDLVREALAKDASSNRHRPVVVQLNKSDLDDAVRSADLGLETGSWPVVTASAERGEGVVETLEMALTNVIDRMRTREESKIEVKADHHPLLDALRQILRDTVTEHMASLEQETMSRVMAAVSTTLTSKRSDESTAPRLDKLDRGLAQVRDAVDASRLAAGAAEKEALRSATNQQQTIGALASTLEHATNDHHQATTALANLVERTSTDIAKLVIALRETATRTAEIQATNTELATRTNELSLRMDALAIETQTEALSVETRLREQIVQIGTMVRRAVEGIAADLKRYDVREPLTAVAAEVGKLHEKTENVTTALAPIATATTGLPARIATTEATFQRDLREIFGPKLARIDNAVQVMQVDAGESFTRAEARIGEIQNGLTELLDELKKRKKGWFS